MPDKRYLKTIGFNNGQPYYVPEKLSELTDDVGYALTTDIPTQVSELENDADYLVPEDIEGKANVSGTYKDFVAGLADQLNSTQSVINQVPYNFRSTGGTSDVGDREWIKLVGASACVNQLVQNGDFASDDGWTFSNATKSVTNNIMTGVMGDNTNVSTLYCFSVPKTTNHKVLALADVMCTANTNVRVRFPKPGSGGVALTANTWTKLAKVISNDTESTQFGIQFDSVTGESANVKKVMLIDLTTYFGSSTIPDYIYSLEQATAGSGIAWLRTYFPQLLEYHAYSVPTMKHVTGLTAHVMTGVNQFDKSAVTPNKTIDSTGALVSGSYNVSDPIKVIANTDYYVMNVMPLTQARGVCAYGTGDEFLGNLLPGNLSSNSSGIITTPINCKYVRLITDSVDTASLCIRWSGTMDGTYHPYESHSYPLDSDVVLRGRYELDANNEPVANGDIWDGEKGEIDRRYGIVDLGTLDWTKVTAYTDGNAYSTTITNKKNRAVNSAIDVISTIPHAGQDVWLVADTPNNHMLSKGDVIYIRMDSITDATTFKSAMSGVMLVYELATPTTETAPTFTSPQICNDWGTEEFTGTCEIPVGTVSEYPQNLRDKLQHLPSMAESDGDYIIHQDGTEMTLVPSRAPETPTTDGTYTLKCTVTGGVAATEWVSES